MIQASRGNKSKILFEKYLERAGDVVQVTEHLPNKCKAMSSKSQHCQNKTKQNKKHHTPI
jgi:hypothetical protein